MAEEMNNAPQGQTTTTTQSSAPQIDYDKLSSILDGKIKLTEDKVLGGYFKEQGMSKEEMAEAIEAFKKDRASKTPDVNALNQQISDLDNKLLEAQSDALYSQAQYEAMMMASALGVDAKTVPYLMRMADLSDVVTDGQIDQEKLKGCLSAVLEDIPQLKASREERSVGFKIGADTSEQNSSTQDELRKIFLGK